jgi:hypothetical protein
MSQAEEFRDIDKSIIVLYFGDFDPSGLDIDRSAEERLLEYSDAADFEMVRVALTPDDVVNLPPNPTKRLDKRAESYIAKYGDKCWELDALPPDELRERVRAVIKSYINQEIWQADQERLNREKSEIREMISKLDK